MRDLPTESKVSELSVKVDALVWAYKFGILALLVLFSLVNAIDIFAISYFRNLFRDALGPDHPLPLLTHLFLNFQTLFTCLAVLWPALGFLVVFKSKQMPTSIFVLTGLLVVVLIQIVLMWISFISPMLEMPVGMSDAPSH